jgi:flagellar motor switch protein FliM
LSDVLQRSEVNALLGAGDGGRGSAEGFAQDAQWPSRYDFRAPRLSRNRIAVIDFLQATLAPAVAALLSKELATPVQVLPAAAEQMPYRDFLTLLPSAGFEWIARCPQLDGALCLEMGPTLAYAMVERMLGSNAPDVLVPLRSPTETEVRLLDRIVAKTLESFSQAAAASQTISFDVETHVNGDAAVRLAPDEEMVVVLSLDLRMGENAGKIDLCLSNRMASALSDAMRCHPAISPQERLRRLTTNLGKAGVQLKAVLTNAAVPLRDLAALRVGDVITTDLGINEPVQLLVEGKRKFAGQLVRYKGKRAVKLAAGQWREGK